MPAAERPAVKFVDQIILERPKGVYTGDRCIHKRSRSANEMNGDPVREYSLKKHRRVASLQPYIRDGKLSVEAKDWTPRPLVDGTYGSTAMKELCEDFGTLATDITQGFAEGK
ncbi:hypothetical protein KVR01_009855 [Diaporthe batatas]|uniref:uncharacterized protein n=1 Tax=Diaporthe batatas TaxID=748121 RepID=UPI001D04E9A0|nr:uncharacterized protein KVR01_009855 [Diaporthe batatas]KAG8160319.1 hypothetical protein KVR01_009855 [Diaporthe batatas]